MNWMKLFNISDRYGDQVEATIEDYQELNPTGEFKETDGTIIEILSDEPGDWETVATQPGDHRLSDKIS